MVVADEHPHKAEAFPNKLYCVTARISRQAFYGQRCRCGAGPTSHSTAQESLAGEIRQIHAGSDGTFGPAWVTAELRAKRHRVNPRRVARLMRTHRTAGVISHLDRGTQYIFEEPAQIRRRLGHDPLDRTHGVLSGHAIAKAPQSLHETRGDSFVDGG